MRHAVHQKLSDCPSPFNPWPLLILMFLVIAGLILAGVFLK